MLMPSEFIYSPPNPGVLMGLYNLKSVTSLMYSFKAKFQDMFHDVSIYKPPLMKILNTAISKID